MKRRIAFGPTQFYHIIATANVPTIPQPNAVASIFMNSDYAPLPPTRHFVLNGNDDVYAAIAGLEHIIEEYLGAHIVYRRDY